MAKKKRQNEVVVGIDIGSSKILVLVAEKNNDQCVFLGYDRQPSLGVKEGVVVNIDSTVTAIKKAIEAAMLMSDCAITKVNVGISGSHISSLNSTGRVSIRDNEIDKEDIARVLKNAEAVSIPANQRMLHILPQTFTIDFKTDVDAPLGMHGDVLEAKAHIVMGDSSAIKNIVKSITQCGLEVDKIVLEPLAAAEATLTKDEKELGICLVDIGGGTTDISVFSKGSIQHTSVLPEAGNKVTDDIVWAFAPSQAAAEALKCEHGCATMEMIEEDSILEVEHISDTKSKTLSLRTLAEVVEARYESIFNAVKENIKLHGYENRIPAGIVLTGGGSRIKGCAYLAEAIFGKQVRLAKNRGVADLDKITDIKNDPSFSVGVGLLLFDNEESFSDYGTFPTGKQNNFLTKLKKLLAGF